METRVSKCLLVALILLTTTMLIWTANIISNVNQVRIPASISAYSG